MYSIVKKSMWLLPSALFLALSLFSDIRSINAQTTPLDRELKSLESKIDKLAKSASVKSPTPSAGEWIGRFVVDKASAEYCRLKINKLKAKFIRKKMALSFINGGTRKKLNLPLDGNNNFSEWLTLTFDYIEHARFLDRPFNFEGSVDGNILTGTFYAEITRVGDSCSGEMYFVKKGTLAAKAFIEDRDLRVVRLEHRLAQLQKVNQATPKKKPAVKNAELEKIVKELRRFKVLQKDEQARLAVLKKQSAAQAKELAALKKARADDAKARQERKAAIEKSELAKRRAARSKTTKEFGVYHALIIGIDQYKNLPRLKTAVADANAVAKILSRDYGFKVTKLLNSSRENILDSIDDLRNKLTFNDNLLIYYSGHGQLDKAADEGYWLPVNAKGDRRSRWLSNNTLSSALRALKAKHVMVVADSCYSGRLTRGISVRPRASHDLNRLKKIARKKARVVLTSGGLKPVDDDNGSGHSPFADALLKALSENKGVFDGTSLFNSVRRPVQLGTRDQEPQYSDLRRAGHDGGDFIFVKESAYAK